MRIQLKDLSLKAVAIGAVADIVLTNILILPVVVITDAGIARATPGAKIAAGSFTHALATNKELYVITMLLGSLASVIAGWIAARVARRAEGINGAASAIACVGLGVYALIRYPAATPLWEHITFFILAPILGAVGGLLSRRRNERVAVIVAPPPPPNEATAVSTPIRGVGRMVFVINRLLLVVAAITCLADLAGGLLAFGQRNTPGILGCAVLCAMAVATTGLLLLGGRRLRRGLTNHWLLHVGAVAMLAIPVSVLAVGFVTARSAKAPAAAVRP